MLSPEKNTVPAAIPDEAKHKLADAEEEVRRLRQIVCELLHSNQTLRLAMSENGAGAEVSS